MSVESSTLGLPTTKALRITDGGLGTWNWEQRINVSLAMFPFPFPLSLSPFPFPRSPFTVPLYPFTPSASMPSAAQVPPMPARAGCSPAAREFHLTTMAGPLRTPSAAFWHYGCSRNGASKPACDCDYSDRIRCTPAWDCGDSPSQQTCRGGVSAK